MGTVATVAIMTLPFASSSTQGSLIDFAPLLTAFYGLIMSVCLSKSHKANYLVNAAGIIHSKGYIPDTVSMFRQVLIDQTFLRIQRAFKHENNLVLLHRPPGILPITRLQPPIPNHMEAVASDVPGGGLLGIPHPKGDVVESFVFPHVRFWSLVSV